MIQCLAFFIENLAFRRIELGRAFLCLPVWKNSTITHHKRTIYALSAYILSFWEHVDYA